jgi:hypothetical protein
MSPLAIQVVNLTLMVPPAMVLLTLTYHHPQFHSTIVLGNPIGGLVFSNAFNNGQLQQLHEWTVSSKHPSGLTIADPDQLELHVCHRVLLPGL